MAELNRLILWGLSSLLAQVKNKYAFIRMKLQSCLV